MRSKHHRLPSISIVTPSFDGGLDTLDECLKNVRSQNYPQELIEILLGHGGSKEKILPIAKKYNAKYFLIPKDKQNAEYNRGVAFNKAKHELVLILDHDNFMPTKNFLKEYVQPFIDDKKVVAVESCYYHYDKKYPLMDRYFALFGVLDPVPYYLGKADRMRWDSKTWNLAGKATDKGKYFIVEFQSNKRKIPTVGTNGCMMRRNVIVQNADVKVGHHYPIDVMVDVIMKGHNRFAFTKNSLTHLTGSRGLLSFLKRRYLFMTQYHFEEHKNRRYSVFMKGDEIGILKFVLYSSTFIVPLWDSFRGFVKLRDIAWFVHPIMCFGVTFMYGYATVTRIFKK
jgi:glycosyltransferase involved in cell wall biosynthesis